MPAIGLWRALRGCSGGKLSICALTSGDALSRNQLLPSALTATDSCVRAVAASVPARSPLQLKQPQFHCGNPPPAAEPNTRTLMALSPSSSSPSRYCWRGLRTANVGCGQQRFVSETLGRRSRLDTIRFRRPFESRRTRVFPKPTVSQSCSFQCPSKLLSLTPTHREPLGC